MVRTCQTTHGSEIHINFAGPCQLSPALGSSSLPAFATWRAPPAFTLTWPGERWRAVWDGDSVFRTLAVAAIQTADAPPNAITMAPSYELALIAMRMEVVRLQEGWNAFDATLTLTHSFNIFVSVLQPSKPYYHSLSTL